MSVAVLRNVLEKEALPWREQGGALLVGGDRDNPELIVETAGGHVRCIVIFSVRYRTGKGIGVGSPLRALRRLHDVELTGRETFRLHDSGLEVLISNGAVATITVA